MSTPAKSGPSKKASGQKPTAPQRAAAGAKRSEAPAKAAGRTPRPASKGAKEGAPRPYARAMHPEKLVDKPGRKPRVADSGPREPKGPTLEAARAEEFRLRSIAQMKAMSGLGFKVPDGWTYRTSVDELKVFTASKCNVMECGKMHCDHKDRTALWSAWASMSESTAAPSNPTLPSLHVECPNPSPVSVCALVRRYPGFWVKVRHGMEWKLVSDKTVLMARLRPTLEQHWERKLASSALASEHKKWLRTMARGKRGIVSALAWRQWQQRQTEVRVLTADEADDDNTYQSEWQALTPRCGVPPLEDGKEDPGLLRVLIDTQNSENDVFRAGLVDQNRFRIHVRGCRAPVGFACARTTSCGCASGCPECDYEAFDVVVAECLVVAQAAKYAACTKPVYIMCVDGDLAKTTGVVAETAVLEKTTMTQRGTRATPGMFGLYLSSSVGVPTLAVECVSAFVATAFWRIPTTGAIQAGCMYVLEKYVGAPAEVVPEDPEEPWVEITSPSDVVATFVAPGLRARNASVFVRQRVKEQLDVLVVGALGYTDVRAASVERSVRAYCSRLASGRNVLWRAEDLLALSSAALEYAVRGMAETEVGAGATCTRAKSALKEAGEARKGGASVSGASTAFAEEWIAADQDSGTHIVRAALAMQSSMWPIYLSSYVSAVNVPNREVFYNYLLKIAVVSTLAMALGGLLEEVVIQLAADKIGWGWAARLLFHVIIAIFERWQGAGWLTLLGHVLFPWLSRERAETAHFFWNLCNTIAHHRRLFDKSRLYKAWPNLTPVPVEAVDPPGIPGMRPMRARVREAWTTVLQTLKKLVLKCGACVTAIPQCNWRGRPKKFSSLPVDDDELEISLVIDPAAEDEKDSEALFPSAPLMGSEVEMASMSAIGDSGSDDEEVFNEVEASVAFSVFWLLKWLFGSVAKGVRYFARLWRRFSYKNAYASANWGKARLDLWNSQRRTWYGQEGVRTIPLGSHLLPCATVVCGADKLTMVANGTQQVFIRGRRSKKVSPNLSRVVVYVTDYVAVLHVTDVPAGVAARFFTDPHPNDSWTLEQCESWASEMAQRHITRRGLGNMLYTRGWYTELYEPGAYTDAQKRKFGDLESSYEFRGFLKREIVGLGKDTSVAEDGTFTLVAKPRIIVDCPGLHQRRLIGTTKANLRWMRSCTDESTQHAACPGWSLLALSIRFALALSRGKWALEADGSKWDAWQRRPLRLAHVKFTTLLGTGTEDFHVAVMGEPTVRFSDGSVIKNLVGHPSGASNTTDTNTECNLMIQATALENLALTSARWGGAGANEAWCQALGDDALVFFPGDTAGHLPVAEFMSECYKLGHPMTGGWRYIKTSTFCSSACWPCEPMEVRTATGASVTIRHFYGLLPGRILYKRGCTHLEYTLNVCLWLIQQTVVNEIAWSEHIPVARVLLRHMVRLTRHARTPGERILRSTEDLRHHEWKSTKEGDAPKGRSPGDPEVEAMMNSFYGEPLGAPSWTGADGAEERLDDLLSSVSSIPFWLSNVHVNQILCAEANGPVSPVAEY